MRAMDIAAEKGVSETMQWRTSFAKNWILYLQEGLGLGIFMFSACFFNGLLFGKGGYLNNSLTPNALQVLIGLLMGLTALFIFYSPFTSLSGSHINTAVTLAFLRVGKIDKWDAFFYIIFQVIGGTLTVFLMAFFMRENLTAAPLHYVITIPGKYGVIAAAMTELVIAFIMMNMVLFTSDHPVLKNYTRKLAAGLVFIFVVFAGPVSGFGMNPARSFASAYPAHIWTSFWIYFFMPIAGMLSAAELYLHIKKRKQ